MLSMKPSTCSSSGRSILTLSKWSSQVSSLGRTSKITEKHVRILLLQCRDAVALDVEVPWPGVPSSRQNTFKPLRIDRHGQHPRGCRFLQRHVSLRRYDHSRAAHWEIWRLRKPSSRKGRWIVTQAP